MSIKRILVPLPGSADHSGEIEMALSAAKALGTHVEALFISEPPPPMNRSRIGGDMGYGRMAATAEQVNWVAEERRGSCRRRGAFRACAANGIPMRAANEEALCRPHRGAIEEQLCGRCRSACSGVRLMSPRALP